VEHFHTRTRTGKIGNCNKFSPTPYMEMNPDSAQDLGIGHMTYARLISRRGYAVVLVQLTHRVPHDMVFIPFHFHECVNRLTLGLLDPLRASRPQAVRGQRSAGARSARRRAQRRRRAPRTERRVIVRIRPEERPYAWLPDAAHPGPTATAADRAGSTPPDRWPARPAHQRRYWRVALNPNRYKQHGFYFSRQRISCRLRSGVLEKNDLPAHIAFRSVGYLEGGSFPSSTRMNISMACNHRDPVISRAA
jgi:hypothetical protein